MKTKLTKTLAAALAAITCISTMAGTAFAASPAFTDVKAGAWYENAVNYVVEKKLFSGTSATTFDPNGDMTRGMFVTVLSRSSEDDLSDVSSVGFADVNENAYYAAPVNWAAANQYVNGTGNNKFAPETPITREQIAVILRNYLTKTDADVAADENAAVSFNDANAVSNWAKEGVEFVRSTGIMNGDAKGNFNPAATLTRAEAATVFMRLDAKLKGEDIVEPPVVEPPVVEPPVVEPSVDVSPVTGNAYSDSIYETYEKATYSDGNTYTKDYVELLKKNAESGPRCVGNSYYADGVYEMPCTVNFDISHVNIAHTTDLPVTHIKFIAYTHRYQTSGNGTISVWVPIGEYVFDDSTNLKDGKGSFTFMISYDDYITENIYFVIDDAEDYTDNWTDSLNGDLDFHLKHPNRFTFDCRMCWNPDKVWKYGL